MRQRAASCECGKHNPRFKQTTLYCSQFAVENVAALFISDAGKELRTVQLPNGILAVWA
jgi:hypothetical protein